MGNRDVTVRHSESRHFDSVQRACGIFCDYPAHDNRCLQTVNSIQKHVNRQQAADQREAKGQRKCGYLAGHDGFPGEDRPPRSDPALLAVQVFHEYLGGRWRRHADALRHETESLLSWALSARAAHL